jgi:hypothetical protein
VSLSFLGLTCVTFFMGHVMPTVIKNDRWHESLLDALVTQRALGFFISFLISTEQTDENWGSLLLAPELLHKSALNREAPAVPEPGSLALFGTGLVALASTLRTRRRSQPTADGE